MNAGGSDPPVGSSVVVACAWANGGDAAPDGLAELLALGRKVCAGLGSELVCLVFGPLADEVRTLAGRHGAARIDRIDLGAAGDLGPDARVEALAQYCAQQSPGLMLLSQDFEARVIAPRLAARTDSPVMMNATNLELGTGGALQVAASAYGGDTQVVYELAGGESPVVGVMTTAISLELPEASVCNPEVQEIEVDLSGVTERVRVVEAARREGPRLEEAEVIVAGGRGLGAPDNYKLIEELAEALGGMAGASRPLVDDGWVDSSRQVGLTGKITRPALYIAIGISGASQHMAGCSAAKAIVGINSDPGAAIFSYARYGVVGDCLEVLPELIRAARKRSTEEMR